MATSMHCNLSQPVVLDISDDASDSTPAWYTFDTFSTSFAYGDHDFFSGADMLTINWRNGVITSIFGHSFTTAVKRVCTENAISELEWMNEWTV